MRSWVCAYTWSIAVIGISRVLSSKISRDGQMCFHTFRFISLSSTSSTWPRGGRIGSWMRLVWMGRSTGEIVRLGVNGFSLVDGSFSLVFEWIGGDIGEGGSALTRGCEAVIVGSDFVRRPRITSCVAVLADKKASKARASLWGPNLWGVNYNLYHLRERSGDKKNDLRLLNKLRRIPKLRISISRCRFCST